MVLLIDGVNHVEAAVAQVDEGQTHEYNECFKERVSFNGYDAFDRFCDRLMTASYADGTVIAHNGSGLDNELVLSTASTGLWNTTS